MKKYLIHYLENGEQLRLVVRAYNADHAADKLLAARTGAEILEIEEA